MKFFFATILLILNFNFSNSYADIFSNDKNKMTLFGIALGEKQDVVESTPCYEYENVFNVEKLDSLKFKDTRDWKTLIYTESKIPVATGCVEPLISNDDFFNFNVSVYPHSNEIYRVGAIYKKSFIFSDRDLVLFGSTDEAIRQGINGMLWKHNECSQLADSLEEIIFETHKAKGFKKYGGMIFKGNRNDPKYHFRIDSTCAVNGKPVIAVKLLDKAYNPDEKRTYFVTIEISSKDTRRMSNEIKKIRDEKVKKNLDKSGL